MSMWGGFAIFAATAWERMPRSTRLLGVSGVLLLGLIVGGIAWRLPQLLDGATNGWGTTAGAFDGMANSRAISQSPPGWIFGRCSSSSRFRSSCFLAIALWFVWREKSRIALTALAAAMVPIGFSMMDGVARMAPFFSLADAANLIRGRERA